MQNHNCAFLSEGDLCRNDDHCTYKVILSCYPLGPHFCARDQIIEYLSRGGLL